MSQKSVLKKTNPELITLLTTLRTAGREQGAPIWRDIANRLEKPSRLWAEVNVGKLDRVVREGETAIVPGKVLSAGEISRPVTVAAFRFSEQARTKITGAGGNCLTLPEIVTKQKGGKGCRIVG